MPSTTVATQPVRSRAIDDLIMGTNSSSITSKRSVERLYYPDEPHYFRYFVKKPLRRAPLINRGYWLRLKAIDVTVKNFLSRPSAKKKVVINLGCGSDVLPWQCHVRYGDVCGNALFIDVDYPDLMHKKRTIVLETPQLREILGDDFSLSRSDQDPVLINSSTYCQIACDLRELEKLRNTLASLTDLSETEVLFVAEVSITYMDTFSADNVIGWASTIGQAEFCLLEQILPLGPEHPFAKTMLAHFDKLKTSLKSIFTYQTLDSQVQRFNSRGWAHVDIWDLWDAWSGNDFLSSSDRLALDEVEPFDEWEELMLFGRHYFVMHAMASPPSGANAATSKEKPKETNIFSLKSVTVYHKKPIKRRFGNAISLLTPRGGHFGAHLLGMGSESRSDTYDLYGLAGTDESSTQNRLPLKGPSPRVCATVTDLGQYGTLLTGGRGSPAKAFSDAWLLRKGHESHWDKTWDLPVPLYRHSTVRLRGTSLALVMGGKIGASDVSDNCLVFNPEKGWEICAVTGSNPPAAFGAIVCNSSTSSSPTFYRGFLCGGLLRDGTLNTKSYVWELQFGGEKPTICFKESSIQGGDIGLLTTFGADVIDLGTCSVICGGTGRNPSVQGTTFTFVNVLDDHCEIIGTAATPSSSSEWPFMVGSSILAHDAKLTVFGGGATCFSMGTYWETHSHEIDVSRVLGREHVAEKPSCRYLESPKIVPKAGNEDGRASTSERASIISIPRIKLTSKDQFEKLLRDGKPVVIEGLDFGPCTASWSPEHMIERVGKDTDVVVHECQQDTEKMDFNAKNFQYLTEPFAAVMEKFQAGQRLYLRSLSKEKPSEAPANIKEDFPRLAEEFQLPKELDYVQNNLFSSVLRISGRVNMWLHYDVMANVYTQITGSKRMILFPPSDVSHLSFAPGASSSSLDVFSKLDTSSLAATHPHEAILEPGDTLFLPPMWLHTATPESDMSVAVNIFFKDLENAYSAGRDVYGNRDLAAYEKGRQDAAKIGKSFEALPKEIRRFYLSRIADELRLAAEDN